MLGTEFCDCDSLGGPHPGRGSVESSCDLGTLLLQELGSVVLLLPRRNAQLPLSPCPGPFLTLVCTPGDLNAAICPIPVGQIPRLLVLSWLMTCVLPLGSDFRVSEPPGPISGAALGLRVWPFP